MKAAGLPLETCGLALAPLTSVRALELDVEGPCSAGGGGGGLGEKVETLRCGVIVTERVWEGSKAKGLMGATGWR
jgi:hypothetical protein